MTSFGLTRPKFRRGSDVAHIQAAVLRLMVRTRPYRLTNVEREYRFIFGRSDRPDELDRRVSAEPKDIAEAALAAMAISDYLREIGDTEQAEQWQQMTWDLEALWTRRTKPPPIGPWCYYRGASPERWAKSALMLPQNGEFLLLSGGQS